jgi:hypothetical protein
MMSKNDEKRVLIDPLVVTLMESSMAQTAHATDMQIHHLQETIEKQNQELHILWQFYYKHVHLVSALDNALNGAIEPWRDSVK